MLITRGEHGMALYERDGAEHHLPTEATTVFDVTGAGDTVIAAYTTALAAGASFADAAFLSNHAAGMAVRELGTAAVTADQLHRALRRGRGVSGPERGIVLARDELAAWSAAVHAPPAGPSPSPTAASTWCTPGIWRASGRRPPPPTN